MHTIIVKCPSCGTGNRIPAVKQHLRPRCGRCKKPLPMAAEAVVVALGAGELAGTIRRSELPLVVDFYSPTCGPCRTLAPILDTLAKRFFGRAVLAKIDISTNPASAQEYDIRGVPTLLFFKNGVLQDRLAGAPPEAALAARIDALLRR